MPAFNPNLTINVLVSVSKRFINNPQAKSILSDKYDWNTPSLSFKERQLLDQL